MEDLHRDLLALIFLAECNVFDFHVVLLALVGKNALFIDTLTNDRHDGPVANGDGQEKNDQEEIVHLPAVAHERCDLLHNPGHKDDQETKVNV